MKKFKHFIPLVLCLFLVFGIAVTPTEAVTAGAPEKVAGIKGAAKSSSVIKLTWNKTTGADGYQVYRRSASNNWKKIATVKGTSKSTYTSRNLKAGKKYQFRVRAIAIFKSNGKTGYKYGKYSKTVSVKTKKTSKKTARVNVKLCSDENVSVKMIGIKNGHIVISVKNNSKQDYYFGMSYISFNGIYIYDDFVVTEIYSGKSRSITMDSWFSEKYCFTSGQLRGRFYYYNDDTQRAALTFKKNIKTSLPDSNSGPKAIKKTLLAEDSNIALYKISYAEKELLFYVKNKSGKDYYFGINYLDFGGKTYYDEAFVTEVYAKTGDTHTISDMNIGDFKYSGGPVTGQAFYYNEKTRKKINF